MAEKRVSLVIGNAAYAHASVLANPHNDARGVATALARIGFTGISPDRSLAPQAAPIFDVDYNSLRRLLAAFAREAENAEQAVLFYAGHGIEVAGQNYLIPVDAELKHAKDVDFETASLMQVLGTVEGARGLRLVILDACRDNPFRQRLFATRNMSRGLRAIEPENDILVAYSAKHGTVAADGAGNNSPFTTALLNHIENPGLEVVDLFRKVKSAVKKDTGGRQEPYTYGSLGERDVFLVPPTEEPARPASAFDPRAIEHTYWTSIASSDDLSDFDEFLSRFPNSDYGPLARKNFHRMLKACSDVEPLERFLVIRLDSPRRAAINERIAQLKEPAAGSKPAAEPKKEKSKSEKPKREEQKVTPPEPPAAPAPESIRSIAARNGQDTIGLGIVSGLLSALAFQYKDVGFSLIFGVLENWRFFQKHHAPLLPGVIFGLVLCLCLYLREVKDIWKFLVAGLGALLIWSINYDLAFWTVNLIAEKLPVQMAWYIGGFIAGGLGAIAVTFMAQRLLGARLAKDLAKKAVLVGALSGCLIGLDVAMQSTADSDSSKTIPWFCFTVWQPLILMLATVTSTSAPATARG